MKTIETSASVSTTAATARTRAAVTSPARLAMTPVDVVGLSRRVRRLAADIADQGWTLPVAAAPVAVVPFASFASAVPSTGVVYPEPGGPPA